ncbi:MAG: hypothetical protein SNJ82_06875 [Gemmataceae bacterium]
MRSFFAMLILAGVASACSVPVFRYALERWPVSTYTALVIYDQPLPVEQQQRLDDLARQGNLKIVAVHKDHLTPEQADIWDERPLPFVSIRYPDSEATSYAAWSGKLDDLPKQLIDSPARRQLVRWLAEGVSVVWIVVEGDEATDKLLRHELARFQKAFKLPEVEPVDLRTALPLELRFEILSLKRDSDEALFVEQLVNITPELREAKGPIVFPVLGRGRVLWGIFGEGLNANEISTSANYACGACSCQVKEANPGVDLLLPADWPTLLKVEDQPKPPAMPQPVIPPGLQDEPNKQGPLAEVTTTSFNPAWIWQGTAVLAVLLLIIGLVLGRRSPPTN